MSNSNKPVESQNNVEKVKEKFRNDEIFRTTKREAKREKEKNRRTEKEELQKSRNQYRLNRKEEKIRFKKERRRIKDKNLIWYNFFTIWFWLGLVLMLTSLVIPAVFDPNKLNTVLKKAVDIFAGLLSSIGIALLVGCIFDFSKNSEAFMAFVSKLLSDIIVSKKFLTSLGNSDKKAAMKLILQPSDRQVEQYSNVNEYFKKKIDDNMRMFDTNFKTNLRLNVEAKRDEKGRVYCESLLTYHIYKVREEFEPIKLIIEEGTNGKRPEIKIISDDGEHPILENNLEATADSNNNCSTYMLKIPDKLQEKDHLTIQYKITETGKDHWMNYHWKTITPCEGILFYIRCLDDLVIKDHMIFDNDKYYHTDLANDKKSLNIVSSQWLECDTGFYVTVAAIN